MAYAQPQGFLAIPSTGKGPGVLVLHASWGLNDTMKGFCERLAQSGFIAFAPDLYHGKVADNIPDAETLGKTLDANHLQANAEISEPGMGSNPGLPKACLHLMSAANALRPNNLVAHPANQFTMHRHTCACRSAL